MAQYTLPDLPYAYNALEPHIDARTMEIHHTKHHQAYINHLIAALEKHPEFSAPADQPFRLSVKCKPYDQNPGGGRIAAARPRHQRSCAGRRRRWPSPRSSPAR